MESRPASSIPATGASGDGKGFGTDGPLEAGTLSGAGASVPFGESLKGIRAGDCAALPLVDGAEGIFNFASVAGSGSAAAKASAVGNSTRTEGSSPGFISSGSMVVPNSELSSTATFKNG